MKLFRMAVSTAAILLFGLLNPILVAGQGQCHPRLFALSRALFPTRSQVVRDGVEGNRRLLQDDPFHFGVPPGRVGRVTGYYMDAIEGDPLSDRHSYTSYLVSVFRFSRAAQRAFGERWDTWFDAAYFTTPPAAPVTVGDAGEEALFHTLDPSQPPLSELLFCRGAILVEVFQGTATGAPSDEQLRSFYRVATKLDALARKHPHGI